MFSFEFVEHPPKKILGYATEGSERQVLMGKEGD